MDVNEMRVGAVYMIRGGHILRYRGVYGPPKGYPGFNPVPREERPTCLAFGPVVDEGPFDPPCGASIGVSEVRQVITPADLPWVRDRRDQMVARKLDVDDINHLIAELERA
jgi:hypothetical protein